MKTRDLRLLILHVSSRCDQTCAHCSIWQPSRSRSSSREWGVGERGRALEDARAEGASTVLFTGGEPLLCDHIEALARRAKALGLSVHLATNGLGLGRAAAWLAESVDEVFVSLEGPPEVHDRVRGAGMAARLRGAVAAVSNLSPRPRLIARSALSALNAARIESTVATARDMGFDAVSFLPIDTTSEAFGGRPEDRVALRPSPRDVAELRRGILFLSAAGELGNFVLESEEKLMSLAGALERPGVDAPRCNAPEWSIVVEADGAARPCFFQPIVAADGNDSPVRVRRSEAWRDGLAVLGPGNAACAACVCPKFVEMEVASFAERASRAVGRTVPTWLSKAGAA